MPRVAVIGAGISGVNTAGHLLKEGLDVTVFEKSSVIGGVWAYDAALPLEPAYPSAKPSVAHGVFHSVPKDTDPHTLFTSPGPCYESLRNNVPTELMQSSLNTWPEGTPSFATHNVLAAYIQDTANKTGVADHTLLNTKVVSVAKTDRVWDVTTATWDAETKTESTRAWQFDAVVIASGHYHVPKVPAIPGLAEWKAAYPDRVQHSKAYRNARGFEGQTVLLIGGSASSTDIAVELGDAASKIWQSTRNGAFDHPPSMLPDNGERITEVASFGAIRVDSPHAGTEADAESLEGHIPASITLKDGRVIDGIDRVIVATGYQFSFPYLPSYMHRDDLDPQEADDTVLVTGDGQQLHNLWEDIFYVPDPTLAFVGVPFYTATFSLFEFQAIAVAAYLAGHTGALPSPDEMRASLKQRLEEKGYGKLFHSLWGQDTEYAARLMAWVNAGNAGSAEASRKYVDGYSDAWIAKKAYFADLKNKKNILHEDNHPGGK
ncbi:dimethylaniline monooxygenase [Ophiostoma piceae UAMH 11346]|uniref:Dimethylaniline monooxygenase n=1 Tax=Ophiostoma piceae (strain UAMH 11346) TaxID=1262450 RepID=S3CAZ4_OPHP1|nr:dimethylaniline monooxygenase [Ophiostoma piceae UAMH 11346]